MPDKIEGFLEIGTNENGEVVMNLDHDRNGVGHIVFSPKQARRLATILEKQAKIAGKQPPLCGFRGCVSMRGLADTFGLPVCHEALRSRRSWDCPYPERHTSLGAEAKRRKDSRKLAGNQRG